LLTGVYKSYIQGSIKLFPKGGVVPSLLTSPHTVSPKTAPPDLLEESVPDEREQ